jgi:hypothetical protein
MRTSPLHTRLHLLGLVPPPSAPRNSSLATLVCDSVLESNFLLTQSGLPPFTLQPIQQNYSINTFFWFTEARQNPETAPLTIWINGGPGSSSLIGMFAENGPCEVIQMADGSYGTKARMWGWDRSSNILFIDQPTQVRTLSIDVVVWKFCHNACCDSSSSAKSRTLGKTLIIARSACPTTLLPT